MKITQLKLVNLIIHVRFVRQQQGIPWTAGIETRVRTERFIALEKKEARDIGDYVK